MEINMKISQKKLTMELPYGRGILLLGMYTTESKSIYYRDICTPLFTVALFTIAKLWNQFRCPSIDEWIKTMWYIYTMEVYLSTKYIIMSFAGK
jgi:hypothetical protein